MKCKRTRRLSALFSLIVSLVVCAPAAGGDAVVQISTPFTHPLSNAECSGMLDQIINEAFRRIGVKVEIVYTTARRSLVAVNEGEYDGDINRVAGLEKRYPNLVRVPEPNMQMQFVAFAKRDIPISDWDSLRGLRVGMVQGWEVLENNTKDLSNVTQLVEISALFCMLEMGRLDVVLYSKLTGYEELHRLGYNDIRHLSPPLCVKEMFLYLHKSQKELVVPLAEALRAMKRDGTYDKVVEATTCHLH